MSKELAYWRGHFRLPHHPTPAYHAAPVWYWIELIDRTGIWTVDINDDE